MSGESTVKRWIDKSMNEADYQRVIDDLQGVIDDTQHTIQRFEATGMDEQMQGDYEVLLTILNKAVKAQHSHTLVMLGAEEIRWLHARPTG